uniref:Uncharacterized protein n=1 Tax=Caenorhabditis japonica TaxID=281687 RepID=A0A8R1E7V6_CAEJA
MIDLKLCRNLSIMGLSLLLGLIIPLHFEKHPIDSGNFELDSILNMLLNIKMLVGGVIATFLDNTVGGASREQRGFREHVEKNLEDVDDSTSAYDFPETVQRILRAIPILQKLPILPSISQKSHVKHRV